MEIYRYLPAPLLEQFRPEALDLSDFIDLLAKARYVQELEEGVLQRAIAAILAE